MIEQTFYKGYEIRGHFFSYNGDRRLIGYDIRKTISDGTVVSYRRRSQNRNVSYSDIWFESEEAACKAIDAGEIVERRQEAKKNLHGDVEYGRRKGSRKALPYVD